MLISRDILGVISNLSTDRQAFKRATLYQLLQIKEPTGEIHRFYLDTKGILKLYHMLHIYLDSVVLPIKKRVFYIGEK